MRSKRRTAERLLAFVASRHQFVSRRRLAFVATEHRFSCRRRRRSRRGLGQLKEPGERARDHMRIRDDVARQLVVARLAQVHQEHGAYERFAFAILASAEHDII